jgi:DNA-binding MarR family transcriptional regulator
MKTSESKFCGCLYFTTNALARKVEKLAGESWKKIGLAPSHAYLLKLVLEEPGMQAGQLAEQLQLTPSTITRLIEKLEEKKLVTRITEGKTTNVFPTQKAKELKPQMKQCVDEFNEKYSKILGKEESRQLINNMHIIADKL